MTPLGRGKGMHDGRGEGRGACMWWEATHDGRGGGGEGGSHHG